jgi:hypothetical protein
MPTPSAARMTTNISLATLLSGPVVVVLVVVLVVVGVNGDDGCRC